MFTFLDPTNMHFLILVYKFPTNTPLGQIEYRKVVMYNKDRVKHRIKWF